MNADKINYLNIGLMMLAALAAYILPFEVFLFSYAVLGPLHYLTEIAWLHEKQYFTKYRQDYLGLIAVALLLVTFALCTDAILKGMTPLITSPALKAQFQEWGTAALFAAFAGALVLTIVKNSIHRLFAFILILISAVFIRSLESATVVFAVFLPTLIHVFVFTGAFVLFGALKSRSRSGMLSFVAFLLIPATLFLINDLSVGNALNPHTLQVYDPFTALNIEVIKLLHLGDANSPQQVYYSGYGLLVMRFIAYAYTYHYLNWFSKTSVIKWHKVPKVKLAIVLVLWGAAVALYAHDYKVGIIALYFLSFLHVLLEFPLNHLTFLGIGTELRRLGSTVFTDDPAAGDKATISSDITLSAPSEAA